MSDRDPKTGLFLPGNKMPKKRSLPDGLRKAIKKNRVEIFKSITQLASTSLEDTKKIAQDPGKLTNIQAMAMKFWAELRENPSTSLYGVLFSIHGWDLNNIKQAVNEVGEEESDSAQVPMTKEEKLLLLENLKKQVSDKDDT